jgi:hypothetical protein
VPPPIPTASARTQTQCFKFILINSHPFVFRLETRILRFVLATIAPNFSPKRTHGHFGKGTPMAGQRDAARVAPAKRTTRRRQSEEAVRPTTRRSAQQQEPPLQAGARRPSRKPRAESATASAVFAPQLRCSREHVSFLVGSVGSTRRCKACYRKCMFRLRGPAIL